MIEEEDAGARASSAGRETSAEPAEAAEQGEPSSPAAAAPADASAARPKPPRPRYGRAKRRRPAAEWGSWDDRKLLSLEIRDLDLPMGAELEARVAELYEELGSRGLVFRPHVWLSDEWFCPDGVPGFSIPFYLAHPRLARLELHQMLEVEGGTREECMKILRHETGHAIENAYRIRRRRRRRELFGSTSEPYPDSYTPRPYSKSFVVHLERGYAQSHPDEDFAETFAVWLDPASDWRERYEGWQAKKKLEYVDELMGQLGGVHPPLTSTDQPAPLSSFEKTLRTHYEERRAHYGVERPRFYDRDLRRLFSDAPEHASQPSAAGFLARHRRELRKLAGRWTHEYQYAIDRVLSDMIARCRELGLRLRTSPEQTKLDFVVLLTVQTMDHLHSGRHRVAL